MKKSILIFIAIITIKFSWGQDVEHLTFKGIPVTGSIENFRGELQKLGFTSSSPNTLNGEFLGQDYKIFLQGKNDELERIGLTHNVSKDWYHLKEYIDELKDLYSKKYGEPTIFENTIISPQIAKYGLESGEYKYNYIWNLENGMIVISAQFIERQGCVLILYSDKNRSIDIRNKQLEEI